MVCDRHSHLRRIPVPKSAPPTTPRKPRNTLKVARKAVRDIRREQLIEAAIRAISQHGIGETTIADVVQEAGMANGAVNQYFASKDMLLLEALRAVTGEFREIWHEARDKADDDPAARSEEHTSELQSQSNLVCRLLLEKKKNNNTDYT